MSVSSNITHPRTVRSFVRRTGRITEAQERALDKLWPRFGIAFTPHLLDLDAVFGRTAERVLEIGFGDGESLVRQAVLNPALDYLGVEVHRPGVGRCLLHAESSNVGNVRVISHDAIDVLQHQIAMQSLNRINIYFPDPWPKKRHHKRRLLQPEFLALAAGRLLAGGTMRIATDWPGYAEHIDILIAESDYFSVAVRREHCGDRPLDRPTTKFERRGLKRGHNIVDWNLQRPCM